MSSPRVVIDLNSVDEDGETVVFLDDVSGGRLRKGYMAVAFEPEDGISAPARVASIREDLGIAFLQVDWRAMRRDRADSPYFRLDKRGWTTSATRVTETHLTIDVARGNRDAVSIKRSRNATA